MMKKLLALNLFLLLFSLTTQGTNLSADNDIISKYSSSSLQQLLDTGDGYYYKDSYDTALIFFNMVINSPVKENDIEGQKRVIEAFNKSAIIYRHAGDYQASYKLLLKGLGLCEKYHHDPYAVKIYTNIGDIYYHFKKYDLAKSYALKALALSQDSVSLLYILNNLGVLELESGNPNNVLQYLNQSAQLSKQYNDSYLYGNTLNSIALFYKKTKQYDSAFHYFHASLDEVRKNHKNKAEAEVEAQNLSELAKLFFEVNQKDSALIYIDLSNAIATENNFSGILAENYLVLSKIEELKGHNRAAFEFFKKYAALKDSTFNVDRFGEIHQLQRLYEVSKTNQQLEQLSIEQRIKERTIRYQKIIQFITLCVLLLVSAILLVVFFQKKKLNNAYKSLFEKNLKIVELQEHSQGESPKKYKKSALTDEMQEELMDKILALMEDASIICDPKFSLDKLAELLQSNHAYVSQVINSAMNKNFRSFLNSYRIREAQRLFSEPDAAKYTIESVAQSVGFKSQSSFRDAFKEITGVSPNYYLKSMQEQCHS